MTPLKQGQVSVFHYKKLQAEHKRLLDTVCEIATTAPYDKRYVDAIYQCRKALVGIALNHDWGQHLSEDP